jgi:PleD family two-component response regulator
LKQDAALQDIPVIFVTGKNSTGDEVQGLQMGAVDFVAKPIEPTILRARVNTQVRLVKASRQLESLNKELEEEREAMLKFIALTQKNARLADEMTQQLSR